MMMMMMMMTTTTTMMMMIMLIKKVIIIIYSDTHSLLTFYLSVKMNKFFLHEKYLFLKIGVTHIHTYTHTHIHTYTESHARTTDYT